MRKESVSIGYFKNKKNKQEKGYNILCDVYEIFSRRDVMSHRALKKESNWMRH